jgi:hypothetical protein
MARGLGIIDHAGRCPRVHCIGWFCLPIPAVEVESDRDTCVTQLSEAGWRDLKVAAPISEYSKKHGHTATGIRNHSHPITGLGRQTLKKVDQERWDVLPCRNLKAGGPMVSFHDSSER